MANNTTSFLLPEEHRIVSSWLGVEPKEDIPEELTLENALENLGLNQEVSVHSATDFAVATILLERVQQYLPQWASVSEEKVTLGRNYRERAARRTVELTPKSLLTINWADSGPGFSWPEEYSVTFVPLYDVYVVTGSVELLGARPSLAKKNFSRQRIFQNSLESAPMYQIYIHGAAHFFPSAKPLSVFMKGYFTCEETPDLYTMVGIIIVI